MGTTTPQEREGERAQRGDRVDEEDCGIGKMRMNPTASSRPEPASPLLILSVLRVQRSIQAHWLRHQCRPTSTHLSPSMASSGSTRVHLPAMTCMTSSRRTQSHDPPCAEYTGLASRPHAAGVPPVKGGGEGSVRRDGDFMAIATTKFSLNSKFHLLPRDIPITATYLWVASDVSYAIV